MVVPVVFQIMTRIRKYEMGKKGKFGGRHYVPLSRHRNSRRFKLVIILLLFAGFLFVYYGGRYWWRERRWRYIVIHHTASDIGNLEYYRQMHQKERGWPDIAYHFLINNGSYNTSVGQIETSSLWINRSHHYSTKVSYINYFGIAIGLVGNFQKHPLPTLQREALINLVTRLSKQYSISPDRIVGHRELWETDCPGRFLNLNQIRKAIKLNQSR